MSDRGLDEETPESDAQDFTDAERTIFIGISCSGDGEVDDVKVVFVIPVANEGHEEADETTGDVGEMADVGGVKRDELLVMGLDRQRAGGDELVGTLVCSGDDNGRGDFFSVRAVGETGKDVEHFVS